MAALLSFECEVADAFVVGWVARTRCEDLQRFRHERVDLACPRLSQQILSESMDGVVPSLHCMHYRRHLDVASQHLPELQFCSC
jgi:hypothetical protein